jgi:PAS domain S-box-containing protein
LTARGSGGTIRSITTTTIHDSLKESQRRLGQAERISHLAHWDRDLETQICVWSDEIYRILGLSPQGQTFQFAEFVQMTHPDDRTRIRKEVDEAIQSGVHFQVDYRVVRPNGEVRHVHSEGEVVRDETGTARRTVGFLQDVTEQHRAKTALETANRLLEARNIAMQEVLANIQTEKNKIGQRVTTNVEEVILPLLQSLRQGATRPQQQRIDEIDQCLQEIISPFIDNIAQAVKGLTPTELRICSYFRRGLAVKQVAELEHLSPETISTHRRSIRRKLQIAHRKINLTSYLRSIFCDAAAGGP